MKKYLKKWGLYYYLGRKVKRIIAVIKSLKTSKKDVLVYVGLHEGMSFSSIYTLYNTCYGFEANPDIFKNLIKEYENVSNVRLYNYAIADFDGEIEFNISDNNGASSSIGRFDDAWSQYTGGTVNMEQTIKVPCINLYKFLNREDVEYIDDYISDIQGMDLEVLKTLKPFIQHKKIGTITCEVTKDQYRNVYSDLPDNTESGFIELLEENYKLIASGWGGLKDGCFKQVPEDWWEMDCKWKKKE